MELFLIAALSFNLQGPCLQVTQVTPNPGQFTKVKTGRSKQVQLKGVSEDFETLRKETNIGKGSERKIPYFL